MTEGLTKKRGQTREKEVHRLFTELWRVAWRLKGKTQGQKGRRIGKKKEGEGENTIDLNLIGSDAY